MANTEISANRPLFQRYPALAKALLPPQPLAELPTPVTRLALGGDCWVKRDDATGGGYGGNKIRKLELLLPHAKAQGAERIITFGGLGTHHGLATAIGCARMGLACRILLFDQPVTAHVHENLLLMAHYGAELRYLGSLPRVLAVYYLDPARLGSRDYFLFAGGSNPVGVAAYVNAAFELDAQIAAGELPEPAAVYCAAGSTGTLAGLTLGLALCGRSIPVYGVRVIESHVGPFPACTPGSVARLMARTLRYLRGLDPAIPDIRPPKPLLLDDYFGGGYGAPTAAGIAATRIAAEHGLTLDPTYTAKAFAAVLDALERGDGPVLYWHTLASAALSGELAQANPNRLPEGLQVRITE